MLPPRTRMCASHVCGRGEKREVTAGIHPNNYRWRPSPSTTNILSPVACTVCGLPAIELALALVLEFEPLERLLCGLTGVGR